MCRRFYVVIAGVVLLVALLAACRVDNTRLVNPDYVKSLLQKAENLAESQMAMLNKAAEQYQDAARLFKFDWHPFNPESGVYAKFYRHYTSYEILDILQSESLLRPVHIIIRFHYDVLSTPERHTDYMYSEEIAWTDTEFSVLRKEDITRVYPCDAKGEYYGGLPEVRQPAPYVPVPESKRITIERGPDFRLDALTESIRAGVN